MIAPCVPRPASSPPPAGGGLSFAVHRAALHPRSALPPPRRSGLRFSTPVGHGRGLASRPGCAAPGEGVGLPWLRPASPTPGERGNRRSVPATSTAASRCSRCSRLSLSASVRCRTESGGATADQHCCHIHRRQPLAVVLRFARTRIYYARCLR